VVPVARKEGAGKLRAFGYFLNEPAISRRVENESALTAAAMNFD
jgi:hypothetical protein